MKQKWINVVRKDGWFPVPWTTICSEHFEETCFDWSKKRRYLFLNAVPSLKLDIDQHVQESSMGVEDRASFVPDKTIDTPRKKKLRSRIECSERISHQRLLNMPTMQTKASEAQIISNGRFIWNGRFTSRVEAK